MELKDVIYRVRRRIDAARSSMSEQTRHAENVVRTLLDGYGDERVEQAFRLAREMLAPSPEYLPMDFRLRRPSLYQRVRDGLFPVTHVLQISSRYGREYLDDYMPISNAAYVGRGNYKFVYRLPWRMVVKISRNVLPSDPLFGSLYRRVADDPGSYLSPDEMELMEYLSGKRRGSLRDRMEFKFHRLGMERYHYMRVREALPDLVLPTRFFMGICYRKNPPGLGHMEHITPMDKQIMLMGRHLKEFATAVRPDSGSQLLQAFFPKYEFEFNGERFGRIKKKVLQKIRDDFRRVIRFTEELAIKEKLILDIHTENIIITLPEFELKIFDFHLFDEHLYRPAINHDRPEQELVEVLERFVDSLSL